MSPEPAQLANALFRQAADSYDATLATAIAAIRDEPGAGRYFTDKDAVAMLRAQLGGDLEPFETVLAESLQTLAHSFFAILDGATADNADERVVAVGLDGVELPAGLNEYWTDYLADTGRLR